VAIKDLFGPLPVRRQGKGNRNRWLHSALIDLPVPSCPALLFLLRILVANKDLFGSLPVRRQVRRNRSLPVSSCLLLLFLLHVLAATKDLFGPLPVRRHMRRIRNHWLASSTNQSASPILSYTAVLVTCFGGDQAPVWVAASKATGAKDQKPLVGIKH
jgi:hypothetical protein